MTVYPDCWPGTGNDPTTSIATGDQLAYFTYTNSEDSGARSGEISAKEDFSLVVTKNSDTQIKITQKSVVNLYLYIFGSWTSGNVVNSEITSVYDMSIDSEGSLRFSSMMD